MKALFLTLILSSAISFAGQVPFVEGGAQQPLPKIDARLELVCHHVFSMEYVDACIRISAKHARVMTEDLIRACQRASIKREKNAFSMNELGALVCMDEQASKINPDIKK